MKYATKETTIDALNDLLRAEFSAIGTYQQALKSFAGDQAARSDLEECRSSHQQRSSRLEAAIVKLGGKPAQGPGAWGAFIRGVEGGAKAVVTATAIVALEEDEDHGLKKYQELLEKLDVPSRRLVADEIMPGQIRTHATVSLLKRRLST